MSKTQMAGGERPDPWRDEDGWPPESVARRKQAIAYRAGVSRRQYEVLVFLAEGLTNLEIGRKLFVSEDTVKSAVHALFVLLDAKTRAQVVAEAFRRDMLI